MMAPEAPRTSCCPRCGSSDVVPIIFGYPTRETEELANRGEVVLGGCIMPPAKEYVDSVCRACGYRWDVGAID